MQNQQKPHRNTGTNRGRQTIHHWETIRTIVDENSSRGTLPFRFTVSIEQPIFTNEDIGYHRVNAMIFVGSYYVRLATRAIIDLLDMLDKHRDKILSAVDDVRNTNDSRDREKREDREKSKRNGHTKPKNRIPVAKEDLPLLDDATLNQGHRRHRRSRGSLFHPEDKQKP